MKITGFKIPEKDQIYVSVGFLYYLRAKTIGKSFSMAGLQCHAIKNKNHNHSMN